MSLEVNYNKTSTKAEAYEAVKNRINEDMIKKFKVTAKVTHDDSVKNINAKGKGFELKLNFLDDKVVADLSLSLLLKPLRGKINSELEKELNKVI